MGLLVTLFCLALSSLIVVALFRRLQGQHVHGGLWVAFYLLVACGAAIGVWCTFYYEYRLGTRTRLAGFPIPINFFRFEDGQWTDFPAPRIQAWLAAFTNIAASVVLTTLPLWLVALKLRLWQLLCIIGALGVALGMLGERIAIPAVLLIVG